MGSKAIRSTKYSVASWGTVFCLSSAGGSPQLRKVGVSLGRAHQQGTR